MPELCIVESCVLFEQGGKRTTREATIKPHAFPELSEGAQRGDEERRESKEGEGKEKEIVEENKNNNEVRINKERNNEWSLPTSEERYPQTQHPKPSWKKNLDPEETMERLKKRGLWQPNPGGIFGKLVLMDDGVPALIEEEFCNRGIENCVKRNKKRNEQSKIELEEVRGYEELEGVRKIFEELVEGLELDKQGMPQGESKWNGGITRDLGRGAVKKGKENELDNYTQEKVRINEGKKEVGEGYNEDEENGEVAGATSDSRYFMTVTLGSHTYRALFDPGSMLTLVGAEVIKRFKDRMKPSRLTIRNATRGTEGVVGEMRVTFDVLGKTEALTVRAVKNLDQEMILGLDFCKLFTIAAELDVGRWKVRDGEWQEFVAEERENKNVLYGECAGISELQEDQRKVIEALVDRSVPPPSENPGLTNLTEHHIDVQGAPPIKHKFRRMSPKMLRKKSPRCTKRI